MVHDSRSPSLIAIVHDDAQLDAALDAATIVPRLAVMLRDAMHRRERVAALAREALHDARSPLVTLIANAHRIDGISRVQYPASALEAGLPAFEAGLPAGGDAAFGVSAHSLDEALAAERAGAAWVTLSPIFPTPSKPGHAGVGIDALGAVCRAVAIPVFALGGIADAGRAAACMAAGAAGVAAISLFDRSNRAALLAVAAVVREAGDHPIIES